MAITWDTQITNVHTQSERGDISFTRIVGTWQDATAYALDDTVEYSDIVYKCISAHTSVAGGGDGAGGEPNTNTTQWSEESTPPVWTITYLNTSLAVADRLPLINLVWTEWQAYLTKQAGIDTFISNLEETANSNLEARE